MLKFTLFTCKQGFSKACLKAVICIRGLIFVSGMRRLKAVGIPYTYHVSFEFLSGSFEWLNFFLLNFNSELSYLHRTIRPNPFEKRKIINPPLPLPLFFLLPFFFLLSPFPFFPYTYHVSFDFMSGSFVWLNFFLLKFNYKVSYLHRNI